MLNRRGFIKTLGLAVASPLWWKLAVAAFARPQLYMWTDEFDFIIAESAEEAHRIWCDYVGGEEVTFEEAGWERVPTDMAFTLCVDPYDKPKTGICKTVGEWIREHGRGYFAYTEY